MAVKRRGLGRGLDALLGSAGSVQATPGGRDAQDALRQLPVDVIQRGKYQPRMDFDPESLQELADSIRAQGVVQPIVVRPVAAGRFELIAGERRWRASQLAGLQDIPAVVRDVPDDAAIAMALIENIQREDLNPLEEATALARLIDEFDMTHQQAADAVGRSRAAVSNLLRLLDLPADIKGLVESRQLEMGHARALLALAGGDQLKVAQTVVKKGLSVRETERLVKRYQETASAPAPEPVPADPDTRRREQDLAERLGARVAIKHDPRGKGRLVINYASLDELDGILSRIR